MYVQLFSTDTFSHFFLPYTGHSIFRNRIHSIVISKRSIILDISQPIVFPRVVSYVVHQSCDCHMILIMSQPSQPRPNCPLPRGDQCSRFSQCPPTFPPSLPPCRRWTISQVIDLFCNFQVHHFLLSGRLMLCYK